MARQGRNRRFKPFIHVHVPLDRAPCLFRTRAYPVCLEVIIRCLALTAALFALLICLAPVPGRSASMSARQLSDAHVGRSKSELLAQRTFSAAVVAAITRPSVRWRIAPRHRTCWSRVPWAATCNRVRARLLAHRWLFRVADRRYAALFAPRQAFLGTSPAWLVAAFECIHRYEGAWNAATGNGYFGGLQMDAGFMRTYGPELVASKGTANYWTPAEQIAVAIRAHDSGRGFGPWPNTAAACGLL